MLFALASAGSALAANLVPNPSFESNVGCPTAQDQLESLVTGWSKPTNGSPDYFHSCNAGPFSTPSNAFGNESPRTGAAYAGFGLYTTAASNSREYIQTRLTRPLLAGGTYQIRFFVTLAENSGFSIDRIGAHLSTTETNLGGLGVLNLTVHAENTSGVVSSTSGWVQISASYIAGGGEEYLVLGNFRSDAATTVDSGPGGSPRAYYFVDDVSVDVVSEPCLGVDAVDSLVGHYQFDSPNLGDDSSSAGNDGTQLGAIQIGGAVGNALGMDPENNLAEFEVVSSDFDILGAVTGIAWVRPDVLHTSDGDPSNCVQGTVFTKGGNYWFQLEQDNSGLLLQNEFSGSDLATVAINVSANQWTQVAFVRDVDNNVTFYKNGVAVGSDILTELPAVSGSPLSLGDAGAVAEPGRCEFGGRIDEVRIYSCALDADQISTLYAEVAILQPLAVPTSSSRVALALAALLMLLATVFVDPLRIR